jgi:hypothetical protein
MPAAIRAFGDYPLRRVALAASLASVALTFAQRVDPMLNPDAAAFLALAKSLLAGHGLHYREALVPGVDLYAFRAPGYPLFLALGLALGGVGAVVAIQGALNGLAAALTGDVARKLGGGAPAAWIAFALRFVWPEAWHHTGLLMSEVAYEFTTILAVWLALEAVRRRSVAWSVGAAAATVFAVLCRPVGLGLALVLGIGLALKSRRAAVAYAAAGIVLFAPWPIRNAIRLHAFVPFTTNGGATAWAGTTDGAVLPAYRWMGEHPELGEVGFDRHFRALASQNIRANPGGFVKATLARGLVYLGPIRGREPWLWLHRFAMLGAAVALALGTSRRRIVLPLAVWAAQGAIMLPIYLFDRYRFPTDWCVVVACALGIAALAGRVGVRTTAIAAAAALLACFVGSYLLSLGLR